MARPDLYVATINQLRYGAAAEELSEKLAECVDRASSTGKTAELTAAGEIDDVVRADPVPHHS